MGTQDGRASPIYSAQEPVRFSGRTRKRLAAADRACLEISASRSTTIPALQTAMRP